MVVLIGHRNAVAVFPKIKYGQQNANEPCFVYVGEKFQNSQFHSKGR